MSELWLVGALGGKVSQPRVLALGCELAAIFLDLRRMRIKQFRLRSRIVDSLSQQLRPRIADSLSQHLAQLSLSLRRFAREGFVPYTHGWYMGMPEGKLNPTGSSPVRSGAWRLNAKIWPNIMVKKAPPARLQGVGGEAGQTPILLAKSRRGKLRLTAPAQQHSPSQFASLMRAKVDTRGKQYDRSSC